MYLFVKYFTHFCLFTAQISGNMDFVICVILQKVTPHCNFDMLIVLPQDVLSAAPVEGRKWGLNTEWKLKSDHRNGVV